MVRGGHLLGVGRLQSTGKAQTSRHLGSREAMRGLSRQLLIDDTDSICMHY